jgi:hypothetical protein
MITRITTNTKHYKIKNMREIKFRCWDHQNNRWAKDSDVRESIGLVFGVNDYFINIAGERMARWSFVQYTGLKDKNGKEIYEGDISQDGGVVIWNNDDASFCWEYKGKEVLPMEDEDRWCEVVGNIYDSPELLPKDSNDERSVANAAK